MRKTILMSLACLLCLGGIISPASADTAPNEKLLKQGLKYELKDGAKDGFKEGYKDGRKKEM